MTDVGRILCWLALTTALTAAPPDVQFGAHTITEELKFGYQLVTADVNSDGRTDLIAVDEEATELAWFENPGWQRHVIVNDVPSTINVDCADIDGDGVPEIAILFQFEWRAEKSAGIVSLLYHDGDVRRPWRAVEIDRVPAAHRVRWADLSGTGSRVMVVAPMVGLAAEPPDFRTSVPVFLYRPGAWKRELVFDKLQGVLHSIYPIDWDGDGRQELLTASFLGLRLHRAREGHWRSQEIAKGAPEPCPGCGSSEVVQGRVEGERFLAAIEPWHGSEVVIYRERKGTWERNVIDSSFQNGHALAVGDLDGDGRDEVVAGYRGQGYQLYIYRVEETAGDRWRREVLDPGGIAAADCKIRDFNNDGRPDIACIGASTGNLKWYENLGSKK